MSLKDVGRNHPRLILGGAAFLSLTVLLLAVLPSVFPERFPALNALRVDTDPENMLAEEEPARVTHRQQLSNFTLYDQIIVGVVRPGHPEGVFNPGTLARVYELTEYAQTIDGVIPSEVLAPSNVDNIEQAGVGAVSFDWLMPRPPESQEEADRVRQRMLDLPMMKGSMIDADGRALMLYIPIEAKNMSHRISTALLERIGTFPAGVEEYHITGLPVANDTFGVQMFIQMAVSAPVAMLLIFILLYAFFRRVSLILSPMIVALLSVILTMGMLIITGHTVHIMSSMIPIFIMPIAVLDAVHILSEFYDRYPHINDKGRTIRAVLDTLWRPMLFTSLTTTAGFGSLYFTPIPPVQVFGLFVAGGVMVAWLLTIVLIPAYVMLLPDRWLGNFGYQATDADNRDRSASGGLLRWMNRMSYFHARIILALTVLVGALAAYGISRIEINDNPIKWFEKDHRIRVADTVLNQRFAGTYPVYLKFGAPEADAFKQPETLAYLQRLQRQAESMAEVGKTQSVGEIVKTVYRELLGGGEAGYRIPASQAAIAQTLLSYESSHRPGDLYHFVTPTFDEAVIWFQLKSGDNRDVERVVERIEAFMEENPPPSALGHDWFGLTYINVVWQEKMVAGMLKALLSSFVVVLILLAVLFRSLLWGLMGMIPLTLTIALIYGVIGLIGKAYDMPVAVLSSLSLGLAVDYAIHLLARGRTIRYQTGDMREAFRLLFDEPARAIVRNIVIVGIGFTPLILAPLVPYKTVGYLISSILLTAGMVTLLVLPALMRVLEPWIFRGLTSGGTDKGSPEAKSPANDPNKPESIQS